VETVDVPKINDPDDVIVKVTLAALCGSDLHVYRGHAGATQMHTCGHEFIGEVVAMGVNYHSDVVGRPHLYSSLHLGDKVVSPFSINCGECHFCRVGFTCRCPQGAIFGTPDLPGGQAQYVRVPKGGGTLFNLTKPDSWSTSVSDEAKVKLQAGIADSSLLLLADILPTGVFAAIQVLNHPKVLPMITGRPWPLCFLPPGNGTSETTETTFQAEDSTLTFAVVGLGPVGVCACVSLLDMLATRKLPFRIVAIDPVESRRKKMSDVYYAMGDGGKGLGDFVVLSIEEAKACVEQSTKGVGCNAVLEVVGNNSALTLAYDLVRPFGAIASVGVYQDQQMPFTGRQLYNKNVSFDFGRCPARAMFPMAFELLMRRQDVFGGVGDPASLIDKIVDFGQAREVYEMFEKGKCGKVIFDPWK
jgi:threonine dehydrogenase-like Zn-dependent dehydrogenase